MSSKIRCVKILSGVVLAFLCLGAARLGAQTTTRTTSTCLNESSFEFPLWNDAIGWTQVNAYTSIHLADIDGDGQDELIGNGPEGIEIWHWEPHGQAWVNMKVGGPIFASTDTLLTGDVDGDGQAEILQITPNLGSSPIVKVWHYDGTANPALPNGPGVWRLQTQLQLTLTPSVGSNSTPLVPTLAVANLNPSSKQQQLISMAIRVTPGLVYYTPIIYQVNASKTGWTTVQGPTTNGGGTFANSMPGTLQVGDVTGDHLPDLVLLEGVGTFLIFPQEAPSSPGSLRFSTGIQTGPDAPGSFIPSAFALGDTLGAGYDQIFVVRQSYGILGYQFTLDTLHLVSSVPAAGGNGAGLSANGVAGLQIAHTGLITANPTAASILILAQDGLDEYSNLGGPIQKISNTPFISEGRFGDDPSHYMTIQTGNVFAYKSSGQTYSETILIGRDANGIHTLVPFGAGSICASALPGFDLPQRNMSGSYFYFPQFTGDAAQAYASINSYVAISLGQQNTGFDLRTEYSNVSEDPSSYSGYVSKAPYQAGLGFTQSEFSSVQNQLDQEVSDVINARSYLLLGSGIIPSNLQYINMQESSALNLAIADLSSPPNPGSVAFGASIATQVVSSIFDFIGNSGIPAASQLSEVFSVVGDIIADVQQAESSTGSTLQQQGLTLQTQLAATYKDEVQANTNTLDKVLRNWDLLSDLAANLSSSTSTASYFNNVNDAAVNAYAISAWEQLMPSAWNIVAIPCNTGEGVLPSGYQPYFVDGQDNNFADLPYCQSYYSVPLDYVVYAKLKSTPAANFFGIPPQPVALGPIQDLLELGVNWYDVLGRRNGWQQVPLDLSAYGLSVTPTIPLRNPYYTPPPGPAPAPAPATIILSNGEAVPGQSQQSCSLLNSTPDIYQQSAPINSVFPVPIGVQVNDSNGTGVPKAIVQITGVGLSPNTRTITTDLSGSATVYLLANNIVQAPYTATFTVQSSAGAPSCLTEIYKLQNTPAVNGTTSANPDVQAVVSVTGKSALFTTDRLWRLSITDPTGTATSGTMSGQLTHTRGPASCNPVPAPINGGFTPTSKPGVFTSYLGWDFSSCTGLNLFTLTVTGNFTIPLDDGSTYQASYRASTNNQTP